MERLRFAPGQVITAIQQGTQAISPELYRYYAGSFRKGVAGVMASGRPGDRFFDLQQQLTASVSRFAAAKAYRVTQAVRRQAADGNGVVRSQKEYDRRAAGVLKTFNLWQQAEYSTAVTRARTARQWEEFNGPGRDLFPNIRWMPSRSVNLRVAHQEFYNRVWAKSDPFWLQNQPGTEWNCKCDWEETSDPVTDNAAVQPLELPAGLEGNPAETGEIFSDNASYFRNFDSGIRLDSETAAEFPNLQALIDHSPKEWRMDSYTDDRGFLATSRKRIEQGRLNMHETEKYGKEYAMCRTLANSGHRIEYLAEVEGQYDITIDGQTADLKKTASHNHVVDYARKAVKRQGAKVVVFEFEKETKDIHEKLDKLKKRGYRVYFFFTGKNDKLYGF